LRSGRGTDHLTASWDICSASASPCDARNRVHMEYTIHRPPFTSPLHHECARTKAFTSPLGSQHAHTPDLRLVLYIHPSSIKLTITAQPRFTSTTTHHRQEQCASKHNPASAPAHTHVPSAGTTAASSSHRTDCLIQATHVGATSCATWTRKKAAGSASSARASTSLASCPLSSPRRENEAARGSSCSAQVSDYNYACLVYLQWPKTSASHAQ
jgi:hypothetical protein